jgi:hypothetical protein
MAQSSLTREQESALTEHVAGIGHNLGPALGEHAEAIHAGAARHPHLQEVATHVRVMLDMVRSHLSGEHPMSKETSAYVFGGLALVATMTGIGVVAQPVSILLLDSVVVGFTVAALDGEIRAYVDWRCMVDPSYDAVRRELYGEAGAT